MYSKRAGLIIRFHGCDEKVRDSIVANNIQIAVRNPNCIKGFFIPRDLDKNSPKP